MKTLTLVDSSSATGVCEGYLPLLRYFFLLPCLSSRMHTIFMQIITKVQIFLFPLFLTPFFSLSDCLFSLIHSNMFMLHSKFVVPSCRLAVSIITDFHSSWPDHFYRLCLQVNHCCFCCFTFKV